MQAEDKYTLSNNTEAERSVLGACLLSAEAVGTATEILKAEDFYDPIHHHMYKLITELYTSGKPVDIVTVSNEMKSRGMDERMGGQPFLAQLMMSVTTTATVRYHAEIVKEYALRRRMITAGDRISTLARKLDFSPSELVGEVEKEILKASQSMESSMPVSAKELSGAVMRSIEEIYHAGGRKLTGYSSGFRDLDSVLSGFQPGSLNIIAARPSMGKTA